MDITLRLIMTRKEKQITYHKFYDVDKKFNNIIKSKSDLVSKETLLNDLYSNYKDYFIADTILNPVRKKSTIKKKNSNKKRSTMSGVYFNSLKNKYSVLIAADGINQKHYGYYNTLEQAEQKCISVKQKLNLQ
jgi:hypothetical protein